MMCHEPKPAGGQQSKPGSGSAEPMAVPRVDQPLDRWGSVRKFADISLTFLLDLPQEVYCAAWAPVRIQITHATTTCEDIELEGSPPGEMNLRVRREKPHGCHGQDTDHAQDFVRAAIAEATRVLRVASSVEHPSVEQHQITGPVLQNHGLELNRGVSLPVRYVM